MSSDHRRAARLVVNAPAVIESIGQVPMTLHPNLAAVFRRVDAEKVEFPESSFDLSWSIECTEHLFDKSYLHKYS